MMQILVKNDDVRSGRKAKVPHGRLRAAQGGTGVNGLKQGRAARCSGRNFCSEFFTQLFEHFCADLRFHSADCSDLGINGKIFSFCRG